MEAISPLPTQYHRAEQRKVESDLEDIEGNSEEAIAPPGALALAPEAEENVPETVEAVVEAAIVVGENNQETAGHTADEPEEELVWD